MSGNIGQSFHQIPCVANSALKRAGTDNKDIIHPPVVTSIDQDFYMDDLLRTMI